MIILVLNEFYFNRQFHTVICWCQHTSKEGKEHGSVKTMITLSMALEVLYVKYFDFLVFLEPWPIVQVLFIETWVLDTAVMFLHICFSQGKFHLFTVEDISNTVSSLEVNDFSQEKNIGCSNQAQLQCLTTHTQTLIFHLS